MVFDRVIMWVSATGILLGALDRILGNRFGLGKQFEEGLNIMGPLALAMTGLICLAPVAANLIGPLTAPVFRAIGCDPALLGILLPNDTGGYALAAALADEPEAGQYAGLIVAAMFGCTLTFTLPLGITLIDKKDHPYFLYGTLIGLIAVPFGSVAGGLIGGIPLRTVLVNTVPVAILSGLLAIGLKLVPRVMLKLCSLLGKAVSILATVGLAAGGVEYLTGFSLIPGMAPVEEAMATVAGIGLVLMGMMPILTLLTKLLSGPLELLGRKLGLNGTSSAGLILTLCNGIPTMKALKDMDPKGKVWNCAFLVCASAALGDHLGFTAGADPSFITPVILGKLAGGVLSLLLCAIFARDVTGLARQK